MKANQSVERVYELIEQFEFTELSENDRTYVMSVMSVNEYNALRFTLKTTESVFNKSEELDLNESVYESIIKIHNKRNFFVKLMTLPVQLYKVAAILMILIGLYSYIHSFSPNYNQSLRLTNDTVFVYKTDTLYSKFIDTVTLIKEKIVYVSKEKANEHSGNLLSNARYEYDFKKEIGPEDIAKIKDLSFKNNISNDTLFYN
jgi:hypothetical protein